MPQSSCKTMKTNADDGEIPARDSVQTLANVTAGLAKEVDDVKK